MNVDDERDFFAEGADAALAGYGDTPPADVSECGIDAETKWIDGYASIDEGGD